MAEPYKGIGQSVYDQNIQDKIKETGMSLIPSAPDRSPDSTLYGDIHRYVFPLLNVAGAGLVGGIRDTANYLRNPWIPKIGGTPTGELVKKQLEGTVYGPNTGFGIIRREKPVPTPAAAPPASSAQPSVASADIIKKEVTPAAAPVAPDDQKFRIVKNWGVKNEPAQIEVPNPNYIPATGNYNYSREGLGDKYNSPTIMKANPAYGVGPTDLLTNNPDVAPGKGETIFKVKPTAGIADKDQMTKIKAESTKMALAPTGTLGKISAMAERSAIDKAEESNAYWRQIAKEGNEAKLQMTELKAKEMKLADESKAAGVLEKRKEDWENRWMPPISDAMGKTTRTPVEIGIVNALLAGEAIHPDYMKLANEQTKKMNEYAAYQIPLLEKLAKKKGQPIDWKNPASRSKLWNAYKASLLER